MALDLILSLIGIGYSFAIFGNLSSIPQKEDYRRNTYRRIGLEPDDKQIELFEKMDWGTGAQGLDKICYFLIPYYGEIIKKRYYNGQVPRWLN